MRRRWMTVVAAASLSAAAMVVLALPAQANWRPWTNLGGEVLHSGPDAYIPGQVFARNAAGKLIMANPSTAR
jgi:hypothetical protein